MSEVLSGFSHCPSKDVARRTACIYEILVAFSSLSKRNNLPCPPDWPPLHSERGDSKEIHDIPHGDPRENTSHSLAIPANVPYTQRTANNASLEGKSSSHPCWYPYIKRLPRTSISVLTLSRIITHMDLSLCLLLSPTARKNKVCGRLFPGTDKPFFSLLRLNVHLVRFCWEQPCCPPAYSSRLSGVVCWMSF